MSTYILHFTLFLDFTDIKSWRSWLVTILLKFENVLSVSHTVVFVNVFYGKRLNTSVNYYM